MKTCWLKLPSFRQVGDYLKEKYDSAIEVKYQRRQRGLSARFKRYAKPTREDLIYIEDSPNYCDNDRRLGIIGTHGRQCNRNSFGADSCHIMCCGRGYYVQKTIKEEKCKCKFQWCCSVKCETCITEVETYICK
jgi:wingless-type MMTV integration site family, member 5